MALRRSLVAVVAILGLTVAVASRPTFGATTYRSVGANLRDENIYGESLQLCDRSGVDDPRYPTTGFMREDKCTATAEDAGSHFVCVNLPEGQTSSGRTYSPFWTVTNQARSPQAATTMPLPGPWCICMWAYASMYQAHQDFQYLLNCPAIHGWVIDSYDVNDPSQRSALESVCRQCDVVSRGKNSALVDKCASVLDR